MAAAVRLHRRRGRTDTGRALFEGPIVVGEAVAAGADIETLFVREDDPVGLSLAAACSARLLIVSDTVLGRLSTTSAPQSPVAVIVTPPGTPPGRGRVVVAWGVGDPGNCGTLIRSAAAFGYAYGAGPGSADTWSPKVVRSAAGAHFRTSLAVYGEIAEVRAPGRTLVAAVPEGGVPPGPLPPDCAVFIGSESHGLPEEVLAHMDGLITIPMLGGAESLNAGVAGAIVAFVGSADDGAGRVSPTNVLPSQPS